ncbi:hypothetical protein NHX12_006768 [Muraenolepis orangiensis]|uniref:Protein CMSS1 n=1 Tax=Muraenolepis orangiensis TaxID=630683 RepID=A0A9Q0DNM7_9TELE|nr:hypothetical protein NHX12_006768 [Muraenolepis orangiensis]
MGDDLGDEWWTHGGNNSDVSDKEEDAAVEEKKSPEESEKPPTPQAKAGKKRKGLTEPPANAQKKKKTGQEKETVVVQKTKQDDGSTAANPKKKRRKKKTITDVLAVSEPKPGCPADLQNIVVQYFSDKRSVIEMEELQLSDSNFLKSNDLTHSLSSYLKEVCPKWAKVQKQHTEKGSVALLIVCSSALRAIELIKQLTTFKGDAKVMKLFAKHIKVEEQVKLLQKGVTHIGVGTPGRLQCLMHKDGLTVQSLTHLVLDWNWRDQKYRRMADIPEIRVDLLKLLDTGKLRGCSDGKVKIGLF